jgi:hypothetical protein
MGGKHHALAALPPGMTQYRLYRRMGGSQGQSVWARKILPPTGFNPWNGKSEVQGFKSQWGKKVFLFSKTYRLALGMTMTTHLNLAPKLIMCGAIPLIHGVEGRNDIYNCCTYKVCLKSNGTGAIKFFINN